MTLFGKVSVGLGKFKSSQMCIQHNKSLGHIVSREGISDGPDKVKAIMDAPLLINAKANLDGIVELSDIW